MTNTIIKTDNKSIHLVKNTDILDGWIFDVKSLIMENYPDWIRDALHDGILYIADIPGRLPLLYLKSYTDSKVNHYIAPMSIITKDHAGKLDFVNGRTEDDKTYTYDDYTLLD